MTLHTLNKSPFQQQTYQTCFAALNLDSHLVLLEDGVYATHKHSPANALIQAFLDKGGKISAIATDLRARGIETPLLGIDLIDYVGFVQLCCEHNPIQSWY